MVALLPVPSVKTFTFYKTDVDQMNFAYFDEVYAFERTPTDPRVLRAWIGTLKIRVMGYDVHDMLTKPHCREFLRKFWFEYSHTAFYFDWDHQRFGGNIPNASQHPFPYLLMFANADSGNILEKGGRLLLNLELREVRPFITSTLGCLRVFSRMAKLTREEHGALRQQVKLYYYGK